MHIQVGWCVGGHTWMDRVQSNTLVNMWAVTRKLSTREPCPWDSRRRLKKKKEKKKGKEKKNEKGEKKRKKWKGKEKMRNTDAAPAIYGMLGLNAHAQLFPKIYGRWTGGGWNIRCVITFRDFNITLRFFFFFFFF